MHMIGTVQAFNDDRGFGFIAPDEGGKSIFVHITAVQRAGLGPLQRGQRISYDLVRDEHTGRSKAENLKAFKPREAVA